MREYKIRGTNYKIRYNDFYGELTPIIFIHGLGCAGSFDYVEVASFLGVNHRIILIDLLGAGYSDKPLSFKYTVDLHVKYLKEFIEDLNLEEIIIFGHSLGGAIAIELCDLLSNRIKTLILSESNLDPSSYGSASFEIANINENDFDKSFEKKIAEYEESGNTMWVAALRNWLPKAAFEMSVNAVSGGEISWRNILYQFNFPKYFIFGEKSLPDADFEKLQEHGVIIEVVPNAGHSMAWENPEDFAKVIKRCL
ncbi:alpha/beta fold hydrolase [Peptostreptococcus canis]|uniref:Alpha/beta hydrolase n=1 Tax=Peptostreptococcus canis TaxID=1159213 RepID=A0ABR6TIM7_9FIRM|nr:alpha/beta hydrolase [Peptostreptococcus canis]MBC2575255.1 alpha/beta hydrolase [Peptostreptococcus canis]MBP1997563.1 pimeloyl-ACP methyl ester carboxylesterase [Peptostreptococcus canis]